MRGSAAGGAAGDRAFFLRLECRARPASGKNAVNPLRSIALAPAGPPRPVVERLHAEFMRVAALPE
jgi:hypothetical protein